MSIDSSGGAARRRKSTDRPKKPYKDYPLTPHASGKWQKKINGRIYYFGNWGRRRDGVIHRLPGDGWKEALELYKAQADDLHAGRVPRPAGEATATVADACNRFLNFKKDRLDCDRLTQRTFDEYYETCQRLINAFGTYRPLDDLRQDDFLTLWKSLAKRYGPVRMSNEITRVRSVFKFARRLDLVPNEFEKPSRQELRKHRTNVGRRLFTADQVRMLIQEASLSLRAMILLGINAGLGNSDVAGLRERHICSNYHLLDFPRQKTGIERRAILWPETLDAIEAVASTRPVALQGKDTDLIFVTAQGNRWVRPGTDSVAQEFGKLIRRCEISGPKGLGFYSLRHTFRTVADRSKDFPAIRLAMGHADDSIDATYRELIENDRLDAVASQVRDWLFAGQSPQTHVESI